jgi:glycosyltransferase involved in cell wall biosynthesis
MHLVIDLQAAQGENSTRGIGRYSRELARAMAAAPGPHSLTIALNANLETEPLRATLAPLAPLHLWHAPARTAATDPANTPRRRAAETMRAEAITALRPDLLHVASLFEGWPDDAITAWPASLLRPPTAATAYDLIPLIRRADYLDGAWANTGLPAWYLRCLHQLRLADAWLAISASSRQEMIDHLGLPPADVAHIATGIAPDFHPPNHTPAERDALLARLRLPHNAVLFLGGGDLRKNETGLIRAYALLPAPLRARHPLAIIRRGEHDRLRALAAECGLPPEALALRDHVPEPDLPGLYAACALFVFPSLHEGFGLPAAEAMACGAPTIASNTTSLPEVIGRPDAMFDPTDPAAIAARMRQVLDSPALRADLAAHGPRQAARFTWPAVAARAWEALEETHARLRPTATSRKRLAVVTPLPPQPSGIADYAAELLPELARHYDITLVADPPETSAEHLAANLPLIPSAAFLAQPNRFDRVLYQVGNSHLHAAALDTLLPQLPGIVTLHDAFLSGARNWIAQAASTPNAFLADLHRAHGWPALHTAIHEGLHAAIARYPCSLDVLHQATGLILHSRHARALLESHYGPAPLAGAAILPHLRALPPAPDRAEARRRLGIPPDTYLACSFGHAAASKLPALLAAAWRRAGLAEARLVLVGGADPDLGTLAPATLTGRTTPDTWRLWLAAADIAVQLRTASRGETSGAILDAMAHGLPVIANRHGSAAELPPDAVLLLPDPPSESALAEALLHLRDPARRAPRAAAARAAIARHHAPRAIAAAYRDAIEAAYAGNTSHRAAAALARSLAGTSPDPTLLADCARALARAHPAPRPATFLIDTTTATPPASLLAPLLTNHPPHLRIDLVQRRDGAWHHPHAATAALLGLPNPLPASEPADLTAATLLPPLAPTADPADILANLAATPTAKAAE